jgi:hypothetical protein
MALRLTTNRVGSLNGSAKTLPHGGIRPGEFFEEDKLKRLITPSPWASASPQSIPERLGGAQTLEAMLREPSANYEVFARVLATSAYALSGAEMERVARGLIKMLRGEM